MPGHQKKPSSTARSLSMIGSRQTPDPGPSSAWAPLHCAWTSYSDLTIDNLDQDIAQIALNSGTLGIHIRELRESETFEIDTPNATVTFLRPGDYRVETDAQGSTALIVRSGDAELDNGQWPNPPARRTARASCRG